MEFLNLKNDYSKQVFEVEKLNVKSRWSGEVEENRKTFVKTVTDWFIPTMVSGHILMNRPTMVMAESNTNVEKIRDGFGELLDVFTALAEPILWFYALTACILIATKNKDNGFNRLKQVAYAYAAIALLPTFFVMLRWIAEMIKGAIQF